MNNTISFISPDVEHRYIRKLGEEFLDIEFTKNYETIRNSSKPMIIWNPYGYLAHKKETYRKKYELYKEMLEKKKDVYIVERGALPNTIFIEKNYFNVESNSYNEERWNHELTVEQNNKVENYINWLRYEEHTLEPQQSSRVNNSEDFFNELNVDKEKYEQVVFVPLQMHNDTVTLLWCDWVGDTSQFQRYIDYLAKLTPKVLFLIKNHPCEEDNFKTIKETTNLKIVDSFHYKDCIEFCDKVITINSGIGLQAMCWNKPVAVCGKAFYRFEDINLKIDNFAELVKFVEFKWSINCEKIKRFIYYLINEFYTECTMQKISRNASVPTLIKTVRLPKECYIEQERKKEKVKILYLFNEYGWAFEFEARNYQKHSKHEIVSFHYNPLNFDLHKNDLKRILREKPDIVVIPSAWHYYKIARNYIENLVNEGIKIVVQINSHYEIKYFCKYANLIMCSSQKLYNILKEKYNYDNIIKQHHFVDTERFVNLGINKNYLLGWAGRFDNPVKRTNILLKLGYPILIKGNYHSFLNASRSHDEMLDFYNKIDILLITSEHEGSPYPLLEAMSCGKIVLSTDVGIASEVLEKECIIKTTKEEDIIKEFQKKIEWLYSNSNLIQEMGQRNWQYIQKNLAWNNQCERLDKIYNDLYSIKNKPTNKMIYGDATFRDLLIYLLDQNIDFWLINDSCLDAIRFCNLKLQPNTLQLASTKDKLLIIKQLLLSKNWKEEGKNVLYKYNQRIKLYEEEKRKTKIMTLFGLDVQVPYPVMGYLRDIFGQDWRNYGNSK